MSKEKKEAIKLAYWRFKTILSFRLFAVMDVLFSERFKLTTYKDCRENNKTNFCKKEIKSATPYTKPLNK